MSPARSSSLVLRRSAGDEEILILYRKVDKMYFLLVNSCSYPPLLLRPLHASEEGYSESYIMHSTGIVGPPTGEDPFVIFPFIIQLAPCIQNGSLRPGRHQNPLLRGLPWTSLLAMPLVWVVLTILGVLRRCDRMTPSTSTLLLY